MDFLIMNEMGFPILSALIFLPLAGALILLCIPGDAAAKYWALLVTAATALLSLPLYWNFDVATAKYQFGEHASWISALNINYTLGIDGISLLLVLMTTLIDHASVCPRLLEVYRQTGQGIHDLSAAHGDLHARRVHGP